MTEPKDLQSIGFAPAGSDYRGVECSRCGRWRVQNDGVCEKCLWDVDGNDFASITRPSEYGPQGRIWSQPDENLPFGVEKTATGEIMKEQIAASIGFAEKPALVGRSARYHGQHIGTVVTERDGEVYLDNPICTGPHKVDTFTYEPSVIAELERAVIEAAITWHDKGGEYDDGELYNAVEALLKAREKQPST